jgi:hypothetical protein
MPAHLLAEWQEYERLEPFGAIRDNYHAAMIATILANAHRGPRRAPVKMDEFFYVDPETRRERADLEMLTRLEAMSQPEQANADAGEIHSRARGAKP